MFWKKKKKWIHSCSFYKSLFRLTWRLKGCLRNALNSLTAKLSEKKTCAFLSCKISQLLPHFPSRTIFICFFSLQPTFLENFNVKSKAKNLLLLLSHIYSSYYSCAILHVIWRHAECSHIDRFHVPQQEDIKSGWLLPLSDRFNQGNMSRPERSI